MGERPIHNEMADLVAATDGSATALGPRSRWSQALRTVVGLVLNSRFPHRVWWDPSFVQIYNDTYAPILGVKHPARALGKLVAECWSTWPIGQVIRERRAQVVGRTDRRLPRGAWAEFPSRALLLPLASPERSSSSGRLPCGLSDLSPHGAPLASRRGSGDNG